MGHKRPLETGLIFEESRAVFLPQRAAQLSHNWVKLVQGFSVVQALHDFLVLRNKLLACLLRLSSPAITGVATVFVGVTLSFSFEVIASSYR